jgi:hypothetical protein
MARRTRDLIDILPEEPARELLEPHAPLIRECIDDGFQVVASKATADPEFFRPYRAGALATFVYWQIVHRVQTRFQGVDGVDISTNRGFLTILISEKLEIRFKKFNRDRRSSNYPTRHHLMYSFQLRLTGMEEPTRITAGYQLDPLGMIKDIIVTCPRGNQNEWWFSLGTPSDPTLPHPAAKPSPPDDKTPKIRPKVG